MGLHQTGLVAGRPAGSQSSPGGSYGVKVRTLEELEAALRAPAGVAPTRRVWIHESLEGDTQRLW